MVEKPIKTGYRELRVAVQLSLRRRQSGQIYVRGERTHAISALGTIKKDSKVFEEFKFFFLLF